MVVWTYFEEMRIIKIINEHLYITTFNIWYYRAFHSGLCSYISETHCFIDQSSNGILGIQYINYNIGENDELYETYILKLSKYKKFVPYEF